MEAHCKCTVIGLRAISLPLHSALRLECAPGPLQHEIHRILPVLSYEGAGERIGARNKKGIEKLKLKVDLRES